MSEEIDLRIIPSEDYSLNVFLMRIAEQLTEEEFEKLKFYCSGRGGFKKGICENMKNCMSLFTHMKEMRMLSKYNLVTLQAMIWHLNRKDLYRLFVEFCRNQDKTLHFFVPSEHPVNGYQHVDFHIRGTKTSNDLNKLRSELAVLLLCPPENIIIDGLKPTSSLYITFMIPGCCVEFLLDIEGTHKEILHSLGVDRFRVNDKFINCKDFREGEDVPDFKTDAAVEQLLQDNARLQENLEHYQLKYEEFCNEKDKLKRQKEVFQDQLTDCWREWKYLKENSDDEIRRLKKTVNEYQLNCYQLSIDLQKAQQDVETCKSALEERGTEVTLLYRRKEGGISQLSRSLSQESIKELGERSSEIQSTIIETLQSSRGCEITSEIIRNVHKFRTDVEMLKASIENMVNEDIFDEVYSAVLHLKCIEDKIAERLRDSRTDIKDAKFYTGEQSESDSYSGDESDSSENIF